MIKTKAAARSMRRRYGITVEEFNRMLVVQNGLCAICSDGIAQHIDHDHSTGKIRGLLCSNCNTAIGQFRESQKILNSAIEYLDRYKAKERLL